MPTDWPPALTIEIEPVLKLFTGKGFYSSADAGIREAVLNSIDAIGRRKDAEPELEPNIDIIFDRELQTVTILDNGDGMNRDDVTNLFSKVGNSASRVAQNEKSYHAVGEFGIGALSYFLICDRYQIQTLKSGSPPVGLIFPKEMLDGKTFAEECEATKSAVGTKITMYVSSPEYFQMLIDKFSYWMRNVDGLSARIIPGDEQLEQGGLTREVRRVVPNEQPEWIESSNLGPPEDLDIWDRYDGNGQIDVLYRGVFVERIQLTQLWGLEGAIHVDPKNFPPMLNREGFVGDALKDKATPFLQSVHPHVLEKAVECIRELLKVRDNWSLNKAITLWLAVPRSAQYANAARLWDAEFLDRKAFRLLGQTNDREVSISEIIALNADKIYLAPDKFDQANPVIGQAIRVLRARGDAIVQGLQRDGSYLSTISMVSNYSSWLLLNTFRPKLPDIIEVQAVAETLVGQECVAEIYSEDPPVKLVGLGPNSVPFVVVGVEMWINIETEAGVKIVDEVCRRNEGHLGLWVACMMHAPDASRQLEQVGTLLRQRKPVVERLGLVRRQYLRSLLK